MRRLTAFLNAVVTSAVEKELTATLGGEHAADDVKMVPLDDLNKELVSASEMSHILTHNFRPIRQR